MYYLFSKQMILSDTKAVKMDREKMNAIPDDAIIFGLLLIISNKMNTLLEREFKEFDVTTKQFFLSMTIDCLFDSPPTLKEVSRAMGSSHQNVKQVALKLQQKNLLTLEKDEKDSRITRLRMTGRSKDFWKQTDPKGAIFREKMFKAMNSDDMKNTRDLLEKLLSNLSEIENGVSDDSKNP